MGGWKVTYNHKLGAFTHAVHFEGGGVVQLDRERKVSVRDLYGWVGGWMVEEKKEAVVGGWVGGRRNRGGLDVS